MFNKDICMNMQVYVISLYNYNFFKLMLKLIVGRKIQWEGCLVDSYNALLGSNNPSGERSHAAGGGGWHLILSQVSFK